MRHPLLALVLLSLTACGISTDKYPYSPQFVAPDEISVHTLLAPPEKGTPAFEQEVQRVIALQKHLTTQQKAQIMKEDHIEPQMLVIPVLGAQYTPEKYPALYTLLKHTASDSWRICDTIQDYWKSPRPFAADPRVKLYVKSIDRPGYPSGHTMTNGVWAYVLSELFPTKHDALFEKAWQIGYHRIEGGAHFPHHVAAGKRMASAVYQKMRESTDYQRELAAARAELQAIRMKQVDVLPACLTPHCATQRPISKTY